MFLYTVLKALYAGQEIHLYGNGTPLRDWTYVKDVVAGIIAATQRPNGYQVINLGTGLCTSTREMVAHLERLSGKTARIRGLPLPVTDVLGTQASIEKAQRLLGYCPRQPLHGLQDLLYWFQREGLTFERE